MNFSIKFDKLTYCFYRCKSSVSALIYELANRLFILWKGIQHVFWKCLQSWCLFEGCSPLTFSELLAVALMNEQKEDLTVTFWWFLGCCFLDQNMGLCCCRAAKALDYALSTMLQNCQEDVKISQVLMKI